MPLRLTLQLFGGLGNQMFQYAAGRALALRNDAELRMDTRIAFLRDSVYKRTYELGRFPIVASPAGWLGASPFLIEAGRRKLARDTAEAIGRRFYGTTIRETQSRFMPEVAGLRLRSNGWMWGYWQSEQYFADAAAVIARELAPPAPDDSRFRACAERMASSNSIAIGVRLFEEVPGASKAGVGGLTEMRFFNDAARMLAATVEQPHFFVFCTTNSAQLGELELPGPVDFITHDNGFRGSVERLWLFSQASHYAIANSSFYWWGAWLREARHADTRVVASPLFSNRDCVPARWLTTGKRAA